uniref:Elongin-B n=3 Tax=Timema TaxID=61471 RepID=A0A7R9CC04_TIMCR|nr:unnamed protein product [Timema cristinae]
MTEPQEVVHVRLNHKKSSSQMTELSSRIIELDKTVLSDVFLMIRRKKLTIFTDAKDTTSVHELKKIIEGILKVNPTNQQLFNKDNFVMEDDKTLQEYGLTSAIAKAQSPAVVGLALRQENGDFEPLELTPYSSPPDLPDVMKSQESNGQEQLS